MSSFTDPYKLKVYNLPIKDRPFELLEGFDYYSTRLIKTFRIARGYRTNFADVPRILWRYLPPYGRYGKATVVHDYLIDNHPELSMKVINLEFLDCMKILNVNFATRWIMYLGVKLFWDLVVPVVDVFRRIFVKPKRH